MKNGLAEKKKARMNGAVKAANGSAGAVTENGNKGACMVSRRGILGGSVIGGADNGRACVCMWKQIRLIINNANQGSGGLGFVI